MDEDAEESGGLFVWILLQLGLDLDDECRGHGGEQTGLSLELACVRRVCLKTHKYQGGVQIFVVSLDEFLVVFIGLLAVVLVEFGPNILLGRLSVLPWAVGGGTSVWGRKERVTGYYPSAGFPSSTATSPPLPCSSTVPRLGLDVRNPVRRRRK